MRKILKNKMQLISLALGIACLGFCATAFAEWFPYQPRPLAAPQGDQSNPGVAYGPKEKNFLVVYESQHLPCLEAISKEIKDKDIKCGSALLGQLVKSDEERTPIGGPLLIDDHQIATSARFPVVIVAPHIESKKDLFLVVWQQADLSVDLENPNYDILARFVEYDQNSKKLQPASDIIVISDLPVPETHPRVAYHPDLEEFLIVFEYTECHEQCLTSIYARRLSLKKKLIGHLFSVNFAPSNDDGISVESRAAYYNAYRPDIAAGASGYMAVWQEEQSPESLDKIDHNIIGRQILVANNEEPRNAIGWKMRQTIVAWEESQRQPRLAYDPHKNQFLVVWEDHHWGGGRQSHIYGRLLSASGEPRGELITIAPSQEVTSYLEGNPQVTYHLQGRRFFVGWDQLDLSSYDEQKFNRTVWLRVVSPGGLVGDRRLMSSIGEFEYGVLTSHPALACDEQGVLVVWQEKKKDNDILCRRSLF